MNQIRKLLRQYSELIVSVLLIVASIVGVIFGIWPLTQKILSLQQETSELSRTIATLQAKQEFLQSWDEQTLRSMLSELVGALPADQSIETLFSTIDGLTSTGLTVTDLSLNSSAGSPAGGGAKNAAASKGKVQTISFSLKLEGTYEQVRKFFEQAASARRLVQIRNFDLAMQSSDIVKARFNMDVFFGAFPSQLGSVEQPLEAFSPQEDEFVKKIAAMPLYGKVESQSGLVANGVAPTTETHTDLFAPQ